MCRADSLRDAHRRKTCLTVRRKWRGQVPKAWKEANITAIIRREETEKTNFFLNISYISAKFSQAAQCGMGRGSERGGGVGGVNGEAGEGE